jgi:hypothetical protein
VLTDLVHAQDPPKASSRCHFFRDIDAEGAASDRSHAMHYLTCDSPASDQFGLRASRQRFAELRRDAVETVEGKESSYESFVSRLDFSISYPSAGPPHSLIADPGPTWRTVPHPFLVARWCPVLPIPDDICFRVIPYPFGALAPCRLVTVTPGIARKALVFVAHKAGLFD